MSDEDQGQKTEEPSQRKLQEARRKGQVVTSQEVKHAAALLGGTLLIALFIPMMGQGVVTEMGAFLASLHQIDTDSRALIHLMTSGLANLALLVLLPMMVFLVLGVAASMAQHGWLVSTESITPKLEKLSLIKGFKRIFSLRSIVELLKGLLKIGLVGVVGWLVVGPELEGIETLTGLSVPAMLDRVWDLSLQLIIAVLALMSVVAGLDYLYQRWEFMKQQRMSKQELKDEYKQTEGDPMVKSRLRSIRMERARRRMMAAVPAADVVITNPTHFAVALQYEPETMAAPKVTAKGADNVAMRIREIAQEHGIPIVENPPLARVLHSAVDVDDEVPPEQYKAVAEVISYVFGLQRRAMPGM